MLFRSNFKLISGVIPQKAVQNVAGFLGGSGKSRFFHQRRRESPLLPDIKIKRVDLLLVQLNLETQEPLDPWVP